jgi:hypothetical protein
MLQVLRATLTTAPRLERRARRMVILHYAPKTDERLLLVALQHRYAYRTLARLVELLCWQTAQARVHPTFRLFFLNRKKGRLSERDDARARGKKEDSRTNRTAGGR